VARGLYYNVFGASRIITVLPLRTSICTALSPRGSFTSRVAQALSCDALIFAHTLHTRNTSRRTVITTFCRFSFRSSFQVITIFHRTSSRGSLVPLPCCRTGRTFLWDGSCSLTGLPRFGSTSAAATSRYLPSSSRCLRFVGSACVVRFLPAQMDSVAMVRADHFNAIAATRVE